MKKRYPGVLLMFLALLWAVPVFAGSLSTVSVESQILPMEDGSGSYMLKSDGFYCLDVNGAVCTKAEIHYFDHFKIDGTVFNGYYYHGTDGCFLASFSHMVQISNLKAVVGEASAESDTEIWTEQTFDGYFMVGNLGRMTSAPQVRYLSNFQIGKSVLDGFYYFNENGRLVTEPGTYYVSMTCNGRAFDGYYYFGGANGALLMQEGVTPEGLPVDENGRVGDSQDLDINSLKTQLESQITGYQGEWSVYIKDLDSGETLSIGNQSMGSASVIKAFVMAATYQDMDAVLANQAKRMNKDASDAAVRAQIDNLLWNMITVSDNESYNELVRLHSENYDFNEGAEKINVWLEAEGYQETSVQHTLQPSSSQSTGIGDYNITSVEDCGALLEKIYRGECVSSEASDAMLNLLLNQTVVWKIPSGLPSGVVCANKTGENDSNQNDIAIVYGENTTFILCVMSENYIVEGDAFDHIQKIAGMTYTYLDMR